MLGRLLFVKRSRTMSADLYKFANYRLLVPGITFSDLKKLWQLVIKAPAKSCYAKRLQSCRNNNDRNSTLQSNAPKMTTIVTFEKNMHSNCTSSKATTNFV